jgi:leucyl aminopeptidase
MKPEVINISKISPDQSVICIVGKDEIPEWLNLSKSEKEYAVKCLKDKQEYVTINSYFRNSYIVRVSDASTDFKKREDLRRSSFNIRKAVKANNHSELVISSYHAFNGAIEAFTEGLLLSFYSFHKYKTRKDDKDKSEYPRRLLLYGGPDEKDLKWLVDLTDAVYLIRDMINEPVNHLNAPALAEEIRKMGAASGFKVEVLNRGRIEALKMGGLLAVNKGSVDPPVFCILEWKPETVLNRAPLVLVGKGVVYDTGGLNIKTGNHMENMKGDMAGAAAVSGALYTIAKAGLPLHVIGLIPATDNRPGGNAYVQGDIITMYNKMTVEVGNTDAEGRLIMADAISYASKYKPELIIDIATLTGSAAMTFGNQAIAVMGNAERKYFSLLEESGNEVYERTAELPFWDEYGEQIKSEVADIRNLGGREAGAITAGKFLENFAEYPLIHMDIAGPGLLTKDDFYRIKEGPGSGLRLIATFLKNYAGSLKAS